MEGGVEQRVRVEATDFVLGFVDHDNDQAFTLVKSQGLLDHTLALLERFDRPTMVEIGLAFGGSTALFAVAAKPRKLVGLEYSPDRLPRLDRFVADQGLDDVVRTYFGVDQADRDAVAAIIDDELGDDAIDLVVDDASHRYWPTLASFEVLFPRLRPGGLFVIEDWTGLHRFAGRLHALLDDPSSGSRANLEARINAGAEQPVPLSRLAIELMLVQATAPEGESIVDEVVIDQHWITARRGPGPLGSSPFRLADHYQDPLGLLR